MRKKIEFKSLIEYFRDNTKMKGLVVWVIINLLYVFIASFFYAVQNFSYLNFSRGFIPLLVVNSFVGIVIIKKRYCKKNIIYLFMALIIFFGGISAVFAYNVKTAIFGCTDRYEGLLTIMYYFSLMFVSSFVSEKYKKIVVNSILIMGAIQVIYAICEAYEVPYVKEGYKLSIRLIREQFITGFMTNPNFLGTYMVLCISMSIGMYIDEYNKDYSLVYLFLSLLFTIGLFLSNATSALLALIFVFLFVFIYCMINKKYIEVLFIFLTIIASSILVISQGKTALIGDIGKTYNEVDNISKGNISPYYGTKRIYIWENTLKIVPKYLLHGVGIDNFSYAFDGHELISPGKAFAYDKAHNEYLQILVTEGLFCLLSYLIMYTLLGIKSLKNCFTNKELYLVLPLMGYLIQAFFNISVIEVAPVFFVVLGLNVNNKNSEQKKFPII